MSASADDGAMHLKAAKPPSELLLPYSTVNSGAPVFILLSLDDLYININIGVLGSQFACLQLYLTLNTLSHRLNNSITEIYGSQLAYL